jgi:hypothetical protein
MGSCHTTIDGRMIVNDQALSESLHLKPGSVGSEK